MGDPVRVTLETDDDERSVRLYDDEGAVELDGVAFRFDVSAKGRSVDESETDATASNGTADPTDSTTDPTYLTTLDDIPSNTTLRFEALAGRRGVEGIVQRQGDSVVAWENSCAHEPDVRIDKGMGAFVIGGQLVCDNHGARFNCDNGYCTRGPCQGQSLRPIDLEVRGDGVYLTDDRFESCRKMGL
ncbi:Rieske (2Fe-2S) protein [Halomarina rubra]|uniref:Rieske (2Fe-2S) protein n=1 Tax=Halomarina rubra TaxID=2071873 RepID=A0ABD6AX16_9EURY|nr:Rieske 2Fe-2S domain-containing protein [Halomarina rubra]